MKRFFALLLLLCLPACAQAVKEGVVEEAPPVALASAAQESYLPDMQERTQTAMWLYEEAYVPVETAESGGPLDYGDTVDLRRLTPGEAARAKRLRAAYEAGEATGDGLSVLEAEARVAVGVYALDPADYDGESVLLLLPGVCLTDEQILAIIDAYARLGLRFDPDGLNARNCARGEAFMRSLTAEEQARSDVLRQEIERGVLDMRRIGEGAQRRIALDMRVFRGAFGDGLFLFTPYRRLTDEELAAREILLGAKPQDADFTALERMARLHLTGELGCPLSMRLTGITADGTRWVRKAQENGMEGWTHRRTASVKFAYEDENGRAYRALASMDAEDGEPYTLMIYAERYEGKAGRPDDEACMRIAQDFARETLGREDIRFSRAVSASSADVRMEAPMDGGCLQLNLFGQAGRSFP